MTMAIQIFNDLALTAEKIKSDATQQFPAAASYGDFWRQGDIYITKLETVPADFQQTDVVLQLAPGTTKGSRHVLNHDRIAMFVNAHANVLTGPVFKCAESVTVTHPEHGDVICPPGIYGITYQRAFAGELRRVVD